MQLDRHIEAWVQDSILRLARDGYSMAKQSRIVSRFIRETGTDSLEAIRPRCVTEWLTRLGLEGSSSQTRANALSAIRSFTRWASETERMSSNPIERVRIARRERQGSGAVAFTAAEVSRLIEVARRDMDSDNLRLSKGAESRMVLYITLATTGLRIGEARVQLWSDIDLERATLTVTRDKARRRDTIPLCEESLDALRWWRPRSDGLRVFEAVPTHRTLERDLERCGIANLPGQWHRFRKAAITLRAEAGVPIWDLTRLARHVDPRTTLRYVSARDEALARAAESMPRLGVISTLSLAGARETAARESSRRNLTPGGCSSRDSDGITRTVNGLGKVEPGGFDPPT